MPGVTAAYMGYCIPESGGQIYNNELTEGLWLLWEFETRCVGASPVRNPPVFKPLDESVEATVGALKRPAQVG